MAEISRAILFGKLNSLAYKSMESATVFCKLRGNPYVELAHWVHQLLQLPDSDLHRIIKHFEVNPSTLAKEITATMDKLPRGATSISDFSPHLEQAVKEAWMYGTLMFGQASVRSGFIVIGLLETDGLRNVFYGISNEFRKLKLDTLTDSNWT